MHDAGGHRCGAVSWLRADQLVINADEFDGQWLGVLPAICQKSWTSEFCISEPKGWAPKLTTTNIS